MIERIASCTCGNVQFRATGEPIISATCYCDNCQAGARLIEALPHAAVIRDEFGGSPYLTYREDRFVCLKGADFLQGIKLDEKAPTTRFVATCCNAGMYLKYAPGWWVSVYRARFIGDLPPLEIRSQTKFVPAGMTLPQDVPTYRSFPISLFARLSAARIAMWLGR
jgi:hypothetical protein